MEPVTSRSFAVGDRVYIVREGILAHVHGSDSWEDIPVGHSGIVTTLDEGSLWVDFGHRHLPGGGVVGYYGLKVPSCAVARTPRVVGNHVAYPQADPPAAADAIRPASPFAAGTHVYVAHRGVPVPKRPGVTFPYGQHGRVEGRSCDDIIITVYFDEWEDRGTSYCGPREIAAAMLTTQRPAVVFMVGDRVRVVRPTFEQRPYTGQVGTVARVCRTAQGVPEAVDLTFPHRIWCAGRGPEILSINVARIEHADEVRGWYPQSGGSDAVPPPGGA
jgi:hypothetical protein